MMATTKTAKKRKATKRKTTKKTHQHKKRWSKLWLPLIGAAIVVVTCYFLLRAIITSPVRPDVIPPEGFTVHGIDVSHHQGAINWELLRNQAAIDSRPLAFVFIKATEGTDIVDSRFRENFAAARQYGILRGAYHFYRTNTPAKQQAEFFIRHVNLEAGDLPPVLDVEVKPADVSLEDFRQGILEWLIRVEQHYRVKPILYTYHSFRQQYMNDSVFNIYPYWIAHYYVDSLRYHGPWSFWQYSDQGQLPGIKEKVDFDLFHGSYDEMLQLTIKK